MPRAVSHSRRATCAFVALVAACTSAPVSGFGPLDAEVRPDAAEVRPDAAEVRPDASMPPDAEDSPDARVGPRIFRGRTFAYDSVGPRPALDLARWQFSASQDDQIVASGAGHTDGTFELEVPEASVLSEPFSP